MNAPQAAQIVHPAPRDGELLPQATPPRAFQPMQFHLAMPFIIHGQLGVPLVDALSPYDIPGLQGGEDRAPFQMLGVGPKASYNIGLLGYPFYLKQKNARRMQNHHLVFPTHRQILRQVAEVVRDFINERKDYMIQDPAHIQWRVGPGHIQLENLVVLGLKHISKSGFQPVLAYRQV